MVNLRKLQHEISHSPSILEVATKNLSEPFLKQLRAGSTLKPYASVAAYNHVNFEDILRILPKTTYDFFYHDNKTGSLMLGDSDSTKVRLSYSARKKGKDLVLNYGKAELSAVSFRFWTLLFEKFGEREFILPLKKNTSNLYSHMTQHIFSQAYISKKEVMSEQALFEELELRKGTKPVIFVEPDLNNCFFTAETIKKIPEGTTIIIPDHFDFHIPDHVTKIKYGTYANYGGALISHFDYNLVYFPYIFYVTKNGIPNLAGEGILTYSKIGGLLQNPLLPATALAMYLEQFMSNYRNFGKDFVDFNPKMLSKDIIVFLKSKKIKYDSPEHIFERYDEIVTEMFNELSFSPIQGSLILNYKLPIIANIFSNGKLIVEQFVNTESIQEKRMYLPGQEYAIKYKNIPWLQNLIAGNSCSSDLYQRTFDAFGGEPMENIREEKEYLLEKPCLIESQLLELISFSVERSRQSRSESVTFEDVHYILSEFISKVSFNEDLQTIFAWVSGLHKKKIKEMIQDSRSIINLDLLKQRAYFSIFESNHVDSQTRDTKLAEFKLNYVDKKKPIYISLPGNLNFKDIIIIMSDVLSAFAFSDTKLTCNLRFSRSDVLSHYFVHMWNDCVIAGMNRLYGRKGRQKAQEKGLLDSFQGAYWDPRYTENFSYRIAAMSQASLSYGSAANLRKLPLQVALGLAVASGQFTHDELELVESEAKKDEYRFDVIDNLSKESSISEELYDFIVQTYQYHVYFSETLTAMMLTDELPKDDLDTEISNIVNQSTQYRGDCTAGQYLGVVTKDEHYFTAIVEKIKTKLSSFTGDFILSENSDLPGYSPAVIKSLKKQLDRHLKGMYEIVIPKGGNNEDLHKQGVIGGIVVTLHAKDKVIGLNQDKKFIKEVLAEQQIYPILIVVKYDTFTDFVEGSDAIRKEFFAQSGYPAFLRMSYHPNSRLSATQIESLQAMADLVVDQHHYSHLNTHNSTTFLRSLLIGSKHHFKHRLQ